MPEMDASDPSLETAAARVARQVCDNLRTPLLAGIETAVRATLSAGTSQIEQACRELVRAAPPAPVADPWLEWLAPLLRASQPTEILAGLLAAAESATQAAIFVIRGTEAVYWKGHGLAALAALPLDSASAFARAVAAGHPLLWDRGQPLCESLPPGIMAAAVGGVHPLLVRGKGIALLYWSGEGGPRPELLPRRLQLLVEVTGRILESGLGARDSAPAPSANAAPMLPDARSSLDAPGGSAVPAPAPGTVTPGATPAAASPLEARARRYAKVLMEDLELYLNRDRPQEIATAIQERDLYIRLRPDIEKCRLSYLEKFPPASGIGIHLLEEEMVRVLCKGNAAVLGSTYQGLAGA